jgi:hypothetical protein
MNKSLGRWMFGRQNPVLAIVLALVITITGSTAAATDTSGNTPAGVALQATSWVLTVPYGAVKVAYSLGGGILGGLAWLATGGRTETAQAIWNPSMKGDYIVQPQHLTGEKPLHFMGPSSH